MTERLAYLVTATRTNYTLRLGIYGPKGPLADTSTRSYTKIEPVARQLIAVTEDIKPREFDLVIVHGEIEHATGISPFGEVAHAMLTTLDPQRSSAVTIAISVPTLLDRAGYQPRIRFEGALRAVRLVK